MTSFVGHFSLKGYRALPEHVALSRESFIEAVKSEMFRFVGEGGFTDLVAVYEEGTENGHPHVHFFVTSAKSPATLRRLVTKYFKKGDEGQFMSIKPALSEKLDKYFLYIAKGFDGKEGSPVEVVWDTHGYVRCVVCVVDLHLSVSVFFVRRMWSELHEQFHVNAQALSASRGTKRARGVEWYAEFGEKLKAQGKTSKDDVLEEVTRYYVYESKKGFDKFAVTRVFWAVYAVVSAAECHSALLEQVKRMVDV